MTALFNLVLYKLKISAKYEVYSSSILSRPYFKNDLFNFAMKRQTDRAKQQAIAALEKKNQSLKQTNDKNKQAESQDNEQAPKPFDITACLKVELKETPGKVDIDDELKDIFETMKSKKKSQRQQSVAADESSQKIKASVGERKSLFFTPKNTIKIQAPKTACQKKQITTKQQEKVQRKQRWENWKMGQQLRKNFKFQKKQFDKKGNVEKQPQNPSEDSKKIKNKRQKDKQAAKQGQSSSQSQKNDEVKANDKEKSKKKANTTGKKKKQKMIKKQDNYVKTDLKRKYRDRFVGALNRNLRNLSKKNMYKERAKKIESQLQMDQGEIYNSYVISLSKAMFMTISLEDEEEISDFQLNYEIPKNYDKESLQKLIRDLFGFQGFRHGQYETIHNILNGVSTLFVSQTASGKSMTYLLSSIILKGLTIVISPLVSLMLDQLQHLPNDLPAACISSLLNREQRERVIEMVKGGRIQLLFVTPESFLTDFMYHVRQFPPINFVCIDEAHSMSELSHSFRASYLSLQEIIMKYFKYKNGKPVVLCLTATANTETMQSISEKLKIQKTICSNTVINKNLFVTISREQLSGKYESLLRYVRQDPIQKCNGILVYCRTKKIMFQVFNYLRNSGMGCRIYHSGLPHKEKVEVMQLFRRGKLRIVIATIALGMGLDFQNLECVIHINMPKSVQNYIQEIGRAGRRNKRAYCHLFLDKYDYFTERNYFLADQLEPQSFQSIIETLKKNSDGIKKVKKNANKQEQAEDQKNFLKKLTLNQNEEDHGKNKQQPQQQQQQEFDENNIYFEDQEYESQHNADSQKGIMQEQAEQNNSKNNKKQEKVLTPEELQFLEIIEKEQLQMQEERFRPLSYVKAQALTQQTNLKQQAILNILLKIQKTLSRKIFKVLPLSYETIKLSFFKNNQNQLKSTYPFFKKLVTNCKIMKGTIYVPMIRKCNQFKITPIQLLSELHGIGNKNWIKIEMINEIFIWQHRKTTKQTFMHLESSQIANKIIHDFNIIQKTSLTKFNIFYSLCFNNSQKYLMNIIERGGIISQDQELRYGGVLAQFDKYFRQDTVELYKMITQEGHTDMQEIEGQSQRQTTSLSNQKILDLLAKQQKFSAYLPISQIDEECLIQIKRSVELFIRHIVSNNQDKTFVEKIKPYRDGRTMARVFLGVNDTNSNWKVYGEHQYWMKFKDKDYKQLLQAVRKSVLDFIITQGPKFLEVEGRHKKVTTKKQ